MTINFNMAEVGASMTAQAAEVAGELSDQGPSIVLCPNGRIVVGFGNVGLVELYKSEALDALVVRAQAKKDALRAMAVSQPKALIEFTRI